MCKIKMEAKKGKEGKQNEWNKESEVGSKSKLGRIGIKIVVQEKIILWEDVCLISWILLLKVSSIFLIYMRCLHKNSAFS